MPFPRATTLASLFLLLGFVAQSEQTQCLATAKYSGSSISQYTFALAAVDKPEKKTAGPKSCYYGCGAQLLTMSSNKGVKADLTMMDIASSFLGQSGFFQPGEVYLVNHLGLPAGSGGTGMGCFEFHSASKWVHYSQSHVACKKAKAAVCGFWGTQHIPESPTVLPKPAKAIVENPPPTEFTFIPADPQSSSTATDTATATATASTSASASASASATTNASSSSSSVAVIQSENIQYRVVKLKADNLNHEAAANACKKEALGSITSTQYTDLSKQLLKDGYSKVIINKWNGDNYGIGGENCLVLIADTGVFLCWLHGMIGV